MVTWFETKMTSNTTPHPFVANQSSSYDNSYYLAWRAFNGTAIDSTDAWASAYGVTDAFLTLDYGLKYNVTSMYIQAVAITGNVYSPRNVEVYYSNDNIKWNLAKGFYNLSYWAAGEARKLDFDRNVAARYFKIRMFGSYGASYIAIGQIKFNATPSIEKKLVKVNGEFYKYDGANWISIGSTSPTLSEGFSQGMDKIGTEINELIEQHGDIIEVYFYTNVTPYTNVNVTAFPYPQLIYPTSDISLIGVESIDKIALLSTGDAKVAVSFDKGVTWNAYRNGLWEVVANAHNGMSNLELNALSSDQIQLGRNNSDYIRFSYSLSNNAEVDNIKITVSLQGSEELAKTSDYSIKYDELTNKIIYTVNRDMTVSVNYIDS